MRIESLIQILSEIQSQEPGVEVLVQTPSDGSNPKVDVASDVILFDSCIFNRAANRGKRVYTSPKPKRKYETQAVLLSGF